MNLTDLLNLGIAARLDTDGGLLLDAPKGALSADLLDRIRHAKPELLAELLAGRELGEHGELGSICTNPAGKGDTLPDVVARLGGRVGTSGTSRKTADVPVNPLPHKAGTLGTSGTPKNNDGEVQNLNAPASHWRVTFPDRQLLTAHLAPPATLGEVLAIYPDATSAEPAPAPEPGKLSQEEAAELAHLLAAIFPDPIDRAEATEAAARDPVGALRCWRAIATERAGWSEDDVEAFEERAAVAEYDGALPRQEAEALAMQEAQQREGCRLCAHFKQPGLSAGYCGGGRDDLPGAYGLHHPLRKLPDDQGESCASYLPHEG